MTEQRFVSTGLALCIYKWCVMMSSIKFFFIIGWLLTDSPG
uniref:Uncharacterized protein n=1 Tax=Anguilla anguilla TaxID=7936 RepID=A0A0E9U3V8_ANGAN